MNLLEVENAKKNKETVYFDNEEVKIVCIYQEFNIADIKNINENKPFAVDIATLERSKL